MHAAISSAHGNAERHSRSADAAFTLAFTLADAADQDWADTVDVRGAYLRALALGPANALAWDGLGAEQLRAWNDELDALEGRAKGAGASDRTKYGSTRASARSFMVHHTQRISLAAVKYDALAIRKKMLSKKQKLAAHAAPTDGAWA